MRKKHVSKQINSGAVTRKATPEDVAYYNALLNKESRRLLCCKRLNLATSNCTYSMSPGYTV